MLQLLSEHEIPREDFDRWLQALRSGEYKQTTGLLEDEAGYCCLGIACKLLVANYPQTEKYNYENDSTFEDESYIGTFLRGDLPEPPAPGWLVNISSDFATRCGVSLDQLNDIHSFSFEAIAEVLDLVYIQGVSLDLFNMKV